MGARYRLAFIAILFLILLPFILVRSPNALLAEGAGETPVKQNTDPALPLNAGVWNGGQAAFWDFHLFDHFRIFGPPERARGYKPPQPINFSHVRHVQKNGMECQYCHWTVAKSEYAAVPELETCMGCHKFVRGTSEAQQTEIKKLDDYAAQNKPIEWEKVHVMPNYVKFNHKRHVKAGVSCHECHGQIPEMETVERVSSMKMGWCVSCHRAEGTSIDCATCHH